MLIVAFCQAFATVSFHTATNNRIITPSIMGFESLYVAVHCGAEEEDHRGLATYRDSNPMIDGVMMRLFVAVEIHRGEGLQNATV